ncbi:MAG TPA: hypothetical protein PLD59_14300, partial [Tepidisphaeraceae bacterium]|nr:hypothetical protein [Tepidisphaeraceae bacterium]
MITTFDIVIVIVYLAGCIAAGLLSRGSKADTQEYFTAGGGMGSFFGTIIVGLSIAATLFSGISFINYPSVIYGSGILLFVGAVLVSMPASYIILRWWFLPRYLSTGSIYPYDVLETRFGLATRTIAASLFVLMRIGWMATMIYAPTLAVIAMGKLDPDRWFWPIVLVTGLSSTIYTVMAGIRGVIITDAIQMVVIAIGIALTIGFAWSHMPVPFSVAYQDLADSGRLDWQKFSLDPTVGFTFWTVTIGVTVANLGNYLADQMSLQRYLATGSARAACRSFLVNIIGVVVVLVLLAGVGLSLFAFYRHVDDPTLPALTDKIFPHFVATQLPSGLCGLVLAALLAATMSSLTSGINSLAGVVTLDFRERFGSPMEDRQKLLFAKLISLAIGLAATLSAGLVSRLGDLFSATQVILGVFAGPLLACVMLSV